MAKEMMIIFVYDTQLLKEENEDPASAILYFHPHWVSDQQRTALCGQIMGSFYCLKPLFSSPSIISLQSGKFSIQEYGRYVLAVGTDRNIADWVLEYRADTLSSLIQLFHNNLCVMANVYQDDNFSAKLYHMLETYLKILIYSGNIFCNIPTLQLPKSASNVFLEAIEILQGCQGLAFVLGGTMLYHNKVVATQLSPYLTKRLVLTDPYRIKSPAETVNVNYQLPLGVQLLKVYIQEEEYELLQQDSVTCRNITQYFSNKFFIKKTFSKAAPTKEAVISAMKRDQSLIFTTVPEEDTENPFPVKIENVIIAPKPPSRPKFLNLRNKTTDMKPEEKSEVKTVPGTPYHGQTSVCSTPMAELNKVLHQKVMSICVDPNDRKEADVATQTKPDICKTESLNSVLSAISETSDTSLHSKDICKTAPYLTLTNTLTNTRPSASLWDLKGDAKSPEKKLSRTNSICDPCFPVVTTNGTHISKYLYGLHLKNHVASLNDELRVKRASESNTEEWKSLEDLDFIAAHKTKPSCETNASNQEHRKSLTLPLKPLNESAEQLFSPAVRSRSYGGVQLTPLMSKLSILANEERSSGFCSSTTTPSEYKEYKPTPMQAAPTKHNKDLANGNMNKFRKNCELHNAVLFVCGQQDMVVVLLMEEEACSDQSIISKLWENCTEYLGKIEKQLRQCLEMYPAGSQSDSGEPYSYLCMDSEWDTVQRGGPWSGMELGSLTHMHRDFCDNALTEIILRDDESIIYGHQLGKSEVFYHQSVSGNAGLPTPADPMGTVPLKAKRRLERDHAIILL